MLPASTAAAIIAFRASLAEQGIDLCAELNTSWYNNVVVADTVINAKETLSALPSNKHACVIGNTSAMWPHVVRYYNENTAILAGSTGCDDDIPSLTAARAALKDPVDSYVTLAVNNALREAGIERSSMGLSDASSSLEEHSLSTVSDGDRPLRAIDVYYAHEWIPPRLIGFQRLAHIAGMCELHQGLHLCLHPTVGTWFGLRACVVFDVTSPLGEHNLPPALDVSSKVDPAEIATAERMLADLVDRSSNCSAGAPTWEEWAALRRCIGYGKEHQYSDAQLAYHSCKDARFLLSSTWEEEWRCNE